MTIEDDIAFLERVPMLRRLGAPALRMLAIGAESRNLGPGEVLYSAGDQADGAFVVRHGSLSVRSPRNKEDEFIAGPGTLLGETALLAETRRPATARAREDVIVMRISRSMFLKVLEGYPDAALRLRELVAGRTDQWVRDLENVRAALKHDGETR
jgi:CRP-like cAMP-binding protein